MSIPLSSWRCDPYARQRLPETSCDAPTLACTDRATYEPRPLRPTHPIIERTTSLPCRHIPTEDRMSEPTVSTPLAMSYLRVSTKEQAERDGDPEGYSIPAQREANRRKADSLGAEIVAEFVDRGEGPVS